MIIANKTGMTGTPVEYPFQDIELSDSFVKGSLCLPPEFPYFQGHFHENPVLPGICMVEAGLALLKMQLPQFSMTDIELKKCRFSNIVRPNQSVYLEGRKQEGQWNLVWFDDQPKKKIMAQVNVVLG